jgi:hypothetical protein
MIILALRMVDYCTKDNMAIRTFMDVDGSELHIGPRDKEEFDNARKKNEKTLGRFSRIHGLLQSKTSSYASASATAKGQRQRQKGSGQGKGQGKGQGTSKGSSCTEPIAAFNAAWRLYLASQHTGQLAVSLQAV